MMVLRAEINFQHHGQLASISAILRDLRLAFDDAVDDVSCDYHQTITLKDITFVQEVRP